jgi:hypothetical protein
MLVSQQPVCRTPPRQGCLRAALAELQRRGADPSPCEDGLRQRLLILARRLARVQALGNEYARVDLSQQAKTALGGTVQAD